MIRLHSTGLNDATILSNIFIDRFMPKANGEFVKVYIYLLRMLGRPEEAFGLSQMADSLFCTEGDILRALKYWESEKLITHCRLTRFPTAAQICLSHLPPNHFPRRKRLPRIG